MNENFIIQYQESIHDDSILEFKNDLKGYNVIIDKQPEPEYHYATGSLINDIIIFISENQTNLIVSGLIVRGTYDLLKFSITKLISRIRKKAQSKGEEITETKKISVKHNIGDKTIEFEIEANLSDELIEKAIEQSFQLLQEQQTIEILKDVNFLSKEYDYKQAKFIFNEKNNLCEPINYGEIRKEYVELIKKANQDFNS